MRTKDLTFEERMAWGDCPVCHAQDGEFCHSEVGFHVGRKADGTHMKTGEGVHVARLALAPTEVQLVEIRR